MYREYPVCHPTPTIVRILLYLLYHVSSHLAVHQTIHQWMRILKEKLITVTPSFGVFKIEI